MKNVGEENDFREMLKKYKEAVKALGKFTEELHKDELRKRVIEGLKKKGFKDENIDLQPSMSYGRPDIIATKEEEGLIIERLVIEVKGINDTLADKLRRYEIGEMETPLPLKKKIILVLPVIDGENFEVWGLKQIGETN